MGRTRVRAVTWCSPLRTRVQKLTDHGRRPAKCRVVGCVCISPLAAINLAPQALTASADLSAYQFPLPSLSHAPASSPAEKPHVLTACSTAYWTLLSTLPTPYMPFLETVRLSRFLHEMIACISQNSHDLPFSVGPASLRAAARLCRSLRCATSTRAVRPGGTWEKERERFVCRAGPAPCFLIVAACGILSNLLELYQFLILGEYLRVNPVALGWVELCASEFDFICIVGARKGCIRKLDTKSFVSEFYLTSARVPSVPRIYLY